MTLQYTKPEPITLKSHPEFSEKWVQDRVIEDTSILGLGDLDLVKAEKVQPKAGRLDLLLYDDQLNRRYEVELMLGPTDPSHIMRCIEYWDIERRHYPAYDHVAVLVAEDITSRFLNLMSLLAGSIPLIAIQLSALKVDDKILLHCVRVLDQTTLRSDDEYDGGGGPTTTDRAYWEKRASPSSMDHCDSIVKLVSELTGESCTLRYRKRIVDIVTSNVGDAQAWMIPRKTLVRVGGYVDDAGSWVKRFDDAGLTATLRRGNKAAMASFKPIELDSHSQLLRDFLGEVYGTKNPDAASSDTT